jgi:hypothetical protein
MMINLPPSSIDQEECIHGWLNKLIPSDWAIIHIEPGKFATVHRPK